MIYIMSKPEPTLFGRFAPSLSLTGKIISKKTTNAVQSVRDSSITKGTGKIVQGLKQTTLGVGQLAVGTVSLPIHVTKAVMVKSSRDTGFTRIDNMKHSIGNSIGNVVGSIKGQAEKLDKIPSFYKILFLIFFFSFFYSIILDMGIFFGLNQIDLVIYMAWFAVLLLFLSFIGSRRSRLYN